MKKWDGVMQVQNAFFGTKLFMHNGKESILNNDLKEIKDFRQGLLLRPDAEQSANTASMISTASKFSAHEEFLTKYQFRNIDELIDLPKVFFKFHIPVDCLFTVLLFLHRARFRLQCRVQDETGTASLVLFEKDVKSLLNGASSYQLLNTQERNGKLDEFPSDFNRIIDCKYAFKISMDDWQSKKELPSWTVQKMSNDPEIINALIPMITPSKDQTSDVVKDTNVSQLVLESVTDDNGTPFDLLKSITSTPDNNSSLTNKRNRDGIRSHKELRTIDDVEYPTYKKACYAIGLLKDDKEYIEAIKESSHWAPPDHLRELFVTLLVGKELSTPFIVWLETWHLLSQDVEHKQRLILNVPDLVVTDEEKKNVTLFYIEELMLSRGSSLPNFEDMPYPNEMSISDFGNQD
ncbi:hypothetical protein Tco_0676261 [Tanacetum coccineum]